MLIMSLACFGLLAPLLAIGISILQEKLERHEYNKHFED